MEPAWEVSRGAGSLQNACDMKDEAKDISYFDVTHVVKDCLTYNLSFGRDEALMANARPIAKRVVG